MSKALKKNIKENKKGRENRKLFHQKYCSCDKFSFILSFSLGKKEMIFVTIASVVIRIRFSDLFQKVFFRLLYNS